MPGMTGWNSPAGSGKIRANVPFVLTSGYLHTEAQDGAPRIRRLLTLS